MNTPTISSIYNGLELWILDFLSLFVFVSMSFMRGWLSADMCSLLYSYLGFVLSVLSYIGGCDMSVISVVVVGSNMVSTKQEESNKS